MIFSELYGAYYNTVAAVLRKAVQRPHERRSANGYRALCVFRERFIHRTGAHERKMAAAPAGRHNAPPPSADHAAYGAAKAVAEGDFS